ncbi:tRNA (guanosine(46)-N7)-methyltransferase TrmB [Tsukamurella paurometabola]|uniref:tRNA (guanine-N(7)-)-methyltransferase n=1 Tax=Tsukamurella paurometabola TaxID=2061 RepID=A0A3P8L0Z3_TSUPA|nr:tRNA (guanosine(46)-N7)-methyltransferase TrmB [Tsukamurella paurometabola]UEA81122.1 tRNA (guanosine(46)-N7)-methyltransferase TrmB [Tsukamurella paurometabola]VDR38095.1 tRNA (guanine-N(7)-)-methyltransferase [Tsukamurella paurometabola]
MESVPQSQDPRAEHRRLYPRVTSFRSRRASLTPAQQLAMDTGWETLGRDIPPATPLPDGAPDGAPGTFPTPSHPLDAEAWFGRKAPLIVEIGSGTGTSTWAMAQAEPENDVVAVEVYLPGIAQLVGAVQRAELTNVRVIRGDGVAVLEDMIEPGSLTGVRVYFPDPWPKARHHKRRLLQPRMFSLIADRLRVGGILHVATDHADYAEAIAETAPLEPLLRPVVLPPRLADAGLPISVDRPVTKFQDKAAQVGREIHEFVWERVEEGEVR